MMRFLTVLLFVLFFGCRHGGTNDQIEVLNEVVSPNGKFVASSFYCEGGGAGGFTFTNVDVHRSDEPIDARNGLLGKHKTWSGFSDIELQWIDDENLEVTYSQMDSKEYDKQNSVRKKAKHGIKIHYKIRQKK